MTRWARAGSSQKHKKMPEDPTPWEDFAAMRQNPPVKKEKKFRTKQVREISSEAASTSLKMKIKHKLKKIKVKEERQESSPLIENDSYEVSFPQNELNTQDDSIDSCKKYKEPEVCGKKSKRKRTAEFAVEEGGADAELKSKKLKTDERSGASIEAPAVDESESFDATETSELFSGKKLKNRKKNNRENFNVESLPSESVSSNVNDESDTKVYWTSSFVNEKAESPESDHRGTGRLLQEKERKCFYEKVKENRARNGILLLPRDVENKLYRLKKFWRRHRFPEEQIKEMAREARRKEEFNYKKTLKTCFNCRQLGHVLSDCPEVTQDSEQGTGICFKCGSTEHKSARCHIKTSEFPFAKCFICHNTGHLSRDCPENKHGIYPKGGKCNLCESIFHLRKDCPKSSRKKDGAEVEVTAGTINEVRSVDDEMVETEIKTVKQKGPKLVKF